MCQAIRTMPKFRASDSLLTVWLYLMLAFAFRNPPGSFHSLIRSYHSGCSHVTFCDEGARNSRSMLRRHNHDVSTPAITAPENIIDKNQFRSFP